MPRPDRDHFDQLVREHHAAVYRSAQRVLRDGAAAEDVTQDVFVRVLAGKVPLAADAGPRAALCWLATRLALNQLRSARRRQHNESLAAMSPEPTTPAERAGDAEQHAAVHRCIRELPDELRLPLLLRFQDELTFAAISSALCVAESTAHERVRQALASLRSRLGPAAVLLADTRLQQLIAGGDVATAPARLLSRLVALPTSAAPVMIAVKLVAALLIASAGVAAATMLVPDRGPAPAQPAIVAAAALDQDAGTAAADPVGDAAQRREPIPVAAPVVGHQDPAPPTHAKFAGTVRDALYWPVTGARVVAVAAGGLKPFELAATTTDDTGAYRLDVVPDAGSVTASKIRLQVLERGRLLHSTAELTLVSHGDVVPMDLQLAESAGTESAKFSLVVEVKDPQGRPVVDVPITLRQGAADAPAASLHGEQPEGQATTGPDGTATLSGRRAGHKVIWVDGRAAGWRMSRVPFDVKRPGPQRTAVTLQPGGTLNGTITPLAGALPEWTSVWIEEDDGALRHALPAKLPADGTFRFAGLGDGVLCLRVLAHGFSPAAVRGLRANADPVAVQLKRADDVRDVGDHLAELHGRVVDAQSGEGIPFRSDQVEVFRMRAGASTLVFDAIEPPAPVQRMLDERKLEQFHLTGLDAGSWAIVVRVPGHAVMAFPFELRDRELRGDVELKLPRGAKVVGRVVDAEDKPLARVMVFVCGVGAQADQNLAAWAARSTDRDHRAPAVLAASGFTDAEGRFTLDRLPPEVPLRIAVVADGRFAVGEPLRLQDGDRREIELRLPAR